MKTLSKDVVNLICDNIEKHELRFKSWVQLEGKLTFLDERLAVELAYNGIDNLAKNSILEYFKVNKLSEVNQDDSKKVVIKKIKQTPDYKKAIQERLIEIEKVINSNSRLDEGIDKVLGYVNNSKRHSVHNNIKTKRFQYLLTLIKENKTNIEEQKLMNWVELSKEINEEKISERRKHYTFPDIKKYNDVMKEMNKQNEYDRSFDTARKRRPSSSMIARGNC